jgi:hypothetical protein
MQNARKSRVFVLEQGGTPKPNGRNRKTNEK